jgi:single-strand DNA-binding protein
MLNQCQFIGNLGADPEVKSFANGGKICNLRLAVTEKWKAKDTGEQKERTEWVSVTLNSDGLVSVADRFLRKGSKVYVSGKMATRKWQDQSGNDRYSTEVIVGGFDGKLVMLDGAKAGEQSGGGNSFAGGNAQRQSSGFGGGFADDLDDDVPF